ncbi:hypothetical protein L4D09_11700 [Photobacterium makurazakiensis]|uniref:hypothetical protein n=1 Tax=Photobacterium makurazakiensis TaxID=2910234 RepID=UPI003D0D8F52
MKKLLLILSLNCIPFILLTATLLYNGSLLASDQQTLQQLLPLESLCQAITPKP